MTTPERCTSTITYDELQREMPEIVRQALPQVLWNKEKLWSLNIATQPIPTNELSYLLELPVWQLDGIRFQIKPTDVINSPEQYPDQYKRVMNCDMDYPIHIISQNGKLTILDGFHRLAQAMIKQYPTIQAKELADIDLANISVSSRSL